MVGWFFAGSANQCLSNVMQLDENILLFHFTTIKQKHFFWRRQHIKSQSVASAIGAYAQIEEYIKHDGA